MVDRFDALALLYALNTGPLTRALITSVTVLLGYVLRDRNPVRELALEALVKDPPTGRGLVVALGLLGEHLPFKTVVPGGSDYDAVAAWVLSVSAACESSGADVPRDAFLASERPARRICQAALARMNAGHILSVAG